MDKTAGLRLAAWLRPKVTPAQLAREAGVQHSYVSAVLAGQKPPSKRLVEAAERLGIPVDLLFDEKAA